MKAAKIILIALFYAGILYSLFSSIYVHGKATKLLDEASDLFGDTYSDEYKKLDKALKKRNMPYSYKWSHYISIVLLCRYF